MGLDFVVPWGSGRDKLGLFFSCLLRCGSDSLSDPPVLCRQRIPGPPQTTSPRDRQSDDDASSGCRPAAPSAM